MTLTLLSAKVDTSRCFQNSVLPSQHKLKLDYMWTFCYFINYYIFAIIIDNEHFTEFNNINFNTN